MRELKGQWKRKPLASRVEEYAAVPREVDTLDNNSSSIIDPHTKLPQPKPLVGNEKGVGS